MVFNWLYYPTQRVGWAMSLFLCRLLNHEANLDFSTDERVKETKIGRICLKEKTTVKERRQLENVLEGVDIGLGVENSVTNLIACT